MTAKDHNKLLSIFLYIQGGLQLLGGVIVAILYGGIGTMMLSTARRDDEQFMGAAFLVAAVVVGILMILFAGFYAFAATKMLKEKSVGRVLGIIGCCLALLSFPLGTALGIYGLWFLFGDVGRNFYLELTSNGPSMYTTPPPPNSWQ